MQGQMGKPCLSWYSGAIPDSVLRKQNARSLLYLVDVSLQLVHVHCGGGQVCSSQHVRLHKQ